MSLGSALCVFYFDFWLKPLFATIDLPKFRDGTVHLINTGSKCLKKIFFPGTKLEYLRIAIAHQTFCACITNTQICVSAHVIKVMLIFAPCFRQQNPYLTSNYISSTLYTCVARHSFQRKSCFIGFSFLCPINAVEVIARQNSYV